MEPQKNREKTYRKVRICSETDLKQASSKLERDSPKLKRDSSKLKTGILRKFSESFKQEFFKECGKMVLKRSERMKMSCNVGNVQNIIIE
ncbi:hypothetical protein EO98_14240 [Methanosarcina sp. 2.H.T.1A.6]|uniref:hypothetical protein n=1 Tax=unclassified Methanosarcina TaxID=2644672 RepID=UPI000621942A|nr:MULTISPECIES: hypothetical protein [unclassified Methanosarcina]KKG18094.1 hypothetical protein EO94_06075 [Methanosarcina sp. 2.H.T.1A.3]KKG20043.1 hypothetical protein EO98_14240 [Methanosarcina sp. 2.H.T.1A.6]KKG22707.1 hypothetical protein EO96_12695 [Methanosarcina sp. 2.H.T.1A.8]KKG25512.1 hypothetical protein EO97_13690 [Methanosarcina sp. 2.H.T.1A.15]